MRRREMRCELGLHHVAALAAELDSLHVLDGAIAQLTGDDQVHDSHGSEENARSTPSEPVINSGEALGEAAPAEPDANRD